MRSPLSALTRAYQYFRTPPIPYYHHLDTRLIRFDGRDWFRLRDACSSVQIFGGVGSGKTSGSANTFARAYLIAGMGGIVCCAKADEADRWCALARECGREDDLEVFDSSGRHRFNFLDYAQAVLGQNGFDQNVVDFMSRVTLAGKHLRGSGGGDDGGNQYFIQAANQLFANAIPFLRCAYGTIQLADVYRFITQTAQTVQETNDPAWIRRSFCARTLNIVGELSRIIPTDKADAARKAEALRVTEEYGDYWLYELPALGDKTRGSVISTLTSSFYEFQSGGMRRLFCTDTTLTPALCREGKIIILDLPTTTLSSTGALAQQIFKLLFQRTMEAQKVKDGDKTRPVFCFADESQFFMNSYDAEHLSICRQQKVCNIYITQDLLCQNWRS